MRSRRATRPAPTAVRRDSPTRAPEQQAATSPASRTASPAERGRSPASFADGRRVSVVYLLLLRAAGEGDHATHGGGGVDWVLAREVEGDRQCPMLPVPIQVGAVVRAPGRAMCLASRSRSAA